MKYLLTFLLLNSLAFGASGPVDRVHAYAGNHKVTVRAVHGVYWVEMEGSDVFGIGTTVDEAAEDFMVDADLDANESAKPHLTQREEKQVPFVCPPTTPCI